jgi:ATP-dependent helicase HepA
MVSDETGGEGRNFQFVDEIVHYDLPWHVSKIEQRIGRLDRLGRKNPIVYSNVLHTSGEEEDGLLGCMELGFEVFTQSISGLEFSLNTIESRISQVAIENGYDGLIALVDEIKSELLKERSEDDAQGMLDAASLERKSAEVYRKVQSTPERDKLLEKSFCDWFSFVGGRASISYKSAGDFPEGIIEFRPDQLVKGIIPFSPDANGNLPDRLGTFRRQIAQERPDLEFFSVGNSFYDAVCASLSQSPKGRTFAVECHDRSFASWRGFEFSYKIEPKKGLLHNYPGLTKHLDRIFAVRKLFVFVDDGLSTPKERPDFVKLLASLTEESKNHAWWNFTLNNSKVQLLSRQYEESSWPDLVKNAENKANLHAQKIFKQNLKPVFEKERERINEQIRQASLSKSDDHMSETLGLNALLEAISEWNIELDTAGFLSVNGGLIA